MTIPAGWQAYPGEPQYMYNTVSGEVKLIPTAQTVSTAQAYIPGAEGWGEADMGAMGAEHASIIVGTGGGDTLFLDFPKIGTNIGDVVTMDIRFLPPWTTERSLPYVKYNRYRIPSRLWKDSDKKVEYVISWDSEGGPGNCPIQKALDYCIERGNGDLVKDLRPRFVAAWQGIDITDARRHWLQKKDQSGNVVLDANSQPIWEMHPGVITMGKKLHKAITRYHRKGNFLSIFEAGFALQLIKTRTGHGDLAVDYDALDIHPPCVFPEEFQPVLENRINLQDRMLFFRRPEEMEYCAQMIIQLYGQVSVTGPISTNVAGQAWIPHPNYPGYEYQQATGAVRPAVSVGQHYPPTPSAAVPVVPPGMPPVASPPGMPPVASPPGMPPVASPPGMPPAGPPGMPPAGPPGMPPAGPPGMPPVASPPGMPPVASPPGMPPVASPPGMPPVASPPGMPPAGPPGAMSAAQLESQFKPPSGGTPTGSPFDG